MENDRGNGDELDALLRIEKRLSDRIDAKSAELDAKIKDFDARIDRSIDRAEDRAEKAYVFFTRRFSGWVKFALILLPLFGWLITRYLDASLGERINTTLVEEKAEKVIDARVGIMVGAHLREQTLKNSLVSLKQRAMFGDAGAYRELCSLEREYRKEHAAVVQWNREHNVRMALPTEAIEKSLATLAAARAEVAKVVEKALGHDFAGAVTRYDIGIDEHSDFVAPRDAVIAQLLLRNGDAAGSIQQLKWLSLNGGTNAVACLLSTAFLSQDLYVSVAAVKAVNCILPGSGFDPYGFFDISVESTLDVNPGRYCELTGGQGAGDCACVAWWKRNQDDPRYYYNVEPLVNLALRFGLANIGKFIRCFEREELADVAGMIGPLQQIPDDAYETLYWWAYVNVTGPERLYDKDAVSQIVGRMERLAEGNAARSFGTRIGWPQEDIDRIRMAMEFAEDYAGACAKYRDGDDSGRFKAHFAPGKAGAGAR